MRELRVVTGMESQFLISAATPMDSQAMIYSLWLIESIRAGKDGKSIWPSLNPMLTPDGGFDGEDWDLQSEVLQPIAAEAYRDWWTDTASKDEARGRDQDPLRDSGLQWY